LAGYPCTAVQKETWLFCGSFQYLGRGVPKTPEHQGEVFLKDLRCANTTTEIRPRFSLYLCSRDQTTFQHVSELERSDHVSACCARVAGTSARIGRGLPESRLGTGAARSHREGEWEWGMACHGGGRNRRTYPKHRFGRTSEKVRKPDGVLYHHHGTVMRMRVVHLGRSTCQLGFRTVE